MDKDYVLKILEGCGFSSEIDLRVLNQRCLIVIDEDNRLKMHDIVKRHGKTNCLPGIPERSWKT